MTLSCCIDHTTRDRPSWGNGIVVWKYLILRHRWHPNTASNSIQNTAMDRVQLDNRIFGKFVTYGTTTPNPNRNKFSAKFPTIKCKRKKRAILKPCFRSIVNDDGKLTGIFCNVCGFFSDASGTHGLKLRLSPQLILAMKFSRSFIKKSLSIWSWFWFDAGTVVNDTFSNFLWIGPLFACDKFMSCCKSALGVNFTPSNKTPSISVK